MGWLSKFLGSVPKEEMDGIRLNIRQPFWEMRGPKTFVQMFQALDGWLPAGSVLYFEGGSSDKRIAEFMATYAIPEQTHVAFGTIWPRPRVFHVPATGEVLAGLSQLMERHAEPELAVHFHVYRAGEILLEWNDAFADPMLLSGNIPEEQMKVLAQRLGTEYKRIVEPDR